MHIYWSIVHPPLVILKSIPSHPFLTFFPFFNSLVSLFVIAWKRATPRDPCLTGLFKEAGTPLRYCLVGLRQ